MCKVFKKNKENDQEFKPELLYTSRPIIEFMPNCFIQNQQNVDIFVNSLQEFINKRVKSNVHLITFNFTNLNNIDIYFIRAIIQLLDNAIYKNSGYLFVFILQECVEKKSLLFELQDDIQKKSILQ